MTVAANYVQRIERALATLEVGARTGDWPGLAQLAEAAAMSEFHFHRIYRLMTGETPQQTLARARIGGSLPELRGPDGIMGATGASAYASSQSYARALKSLTGATPSQLRADPELLAQVAEALMQPVDGGKDMAIEITELAPLTLVARHTIGDYKALNLGYHALFEGVLAQIAPQQITGLYGVPHDDPRDIPPADCRFDCAITTAVSVEPSGELQMLERPGGPALRLRIPGDYDRVHAAIDHLYRLAIALDLELADSLPLNFYHADPETTPEEELLTDIHLMLQE